MQDHVRVLAQKYFLDQITDGAELEVDEVKPNVEVRDNNPDFLEHFRVHLSCEHMLHGLAKQPLFKPNQTQ